MHGREYDKVFLWTTFTLIFVGFLIFISAAMGFATRNSVAFTDILLKQIFFGLILGSALYFIFAHIDYRIWKKLAVPALLISFFLTVLVFFPSIGFEHGGANRWIDLGFISFQPSELLKLGFIIYLSAWFSSRKEEVKSFKSGLLPFVIMVGLVGLILVLEPDFGTLIVIAISSAALFFVRGAQYKQIAVLFLISLVALSMLVMVKPYLVSRITVFLDPSFDPQGAGYQLKQSLIAIGSGGTFGRGFGMGVQKFKYLPEPMGDSIFSAAAEEFGFVGSASLIGLYLLLFWRGILIAKRAPDIFGRLLATGIIMLIIVQSFMNIASMIGFLPLTGLPLIFVSQGASAFIVAMAGIGILLNISKYGKL